MMSQVWELELGEGEEWTGAPQQLAVKVSWRGLYPLPDVSKVQQLKPHPNIVQLYALTRGQPVPWIHWDEEGNCLFMEYCSHGSASEYCSALVQQAEAAANTHSAPGGTTGTTGTSTRTSNRAAPSSSQGLHGLGAAAGAQQQNRESSQPPDQQQQQQHAGAPQPQGLNPGSSATSADMPAPHAAGQQQMADPAVLMRLHTLEELLRVQFTDLLGCLMKLHANLGMAPDPAVAIYHQDIRTRSLLVDGSGTFKFDGWGLSRVVGMEELATARPMEEGALE
jgi:serine/threonine protein kinase